MPTAQLLLDRRITVVHLTPDVGNQYKEGFVGDTSLSGVLANIQPASAQVQALYGGAYGKTFTMFTTNSGILETDRLTVSGTNDQFIVVGKQDYNYGAGQHLEFTLEKVLR